MPNISIQEIIRSLRVEGYLYIINNNSILDDLISLLTDISAEVPEQYLAGFNKVLQDILSAMQRNDAILLADLLEYRLPAFCSSYQTTEVVN